MPTAHIDYSTAHKILGENESGSGLVEEDRFVSTPYGLSIIEIQGELTLPNQVPLKENYSEEHKEYFQNFIKVDDLYDAVKFGQIEYDVKDPKKVTLFIGKSQRLLGSLVDLDTPLAILRIPIKKDSSDDTNENIKILDIIKKKMIFKQRPLPIM
ncbi:chromosome transmission fidelity protein 8 [Scheffersomyces coipomensis]|uniref:chromosome transmission fidelity protein 8 n=1 Tax=Scheffersomyces coipomensis TaxID=1788519 RepID=UPI00315CA0F7